MASRTAIATLALGLVAAGCAWDRPAGRGPTSRALADAADHAFSSTLGPGDVFQVKVYQEKDLSGVYRVSAAGKINFPLIGFVEVVGLTPSEVANKVAMLLEKDYLRNPQVDVFVTEYNSKKVYVFGQVKKPGTYKYEPEMTIIQAITLAEGFTPLASRNKTSVTRLVNGEEVRITLPVERIGEGVEKNFAILPGDIVFVPESLF